MRFPAHPTPPRTQLHPPLNPPPILPPKGAFGKGRVIYTPPLLGPDIGRFGDLTRALRSRFREAGMDSGDRDEFVAHATLMKVREGDKVWVKGKGKKIVRNVPEEVVERFRDFDFGTQTFRSIELSAMILPKVDGYYQCFARVPF
ncbi:AKAP7 2'5' RNA ligase-like domain-containing protein [Jimgerdemannia flammicorona]|uniref:AKAP7 2'5' RNA ligase-like domain-containing protein n=1 Tax=Jimgerdemannia flammicorona TaxID=994334 RepID=A0A433Q366_9FUNG|nr:AKAP7 2'5' RNA ligase-like domain-containing protein [Jimgerdemannia flammicorona]